jgi:hypothetical protein
MMRDPIVLLNYEAGRRPELAQLMAEIDRLTVAEIEAAQVPLPWMRSALLTLKQQRQYHAWAATADEWAQDGTTTDPVGTVRRWIGSDAYVRVGRTELLIKYGELIWADRSGIWIDTIHTTHVDPKIKTNTVPQGKMTRSAYNLAIRNKARGGQEPAPVEQTQTAPFRIFRPG